MKNVILNVIINGCVGWYHLHLRSKKYLKLIKNDQVMTGLKEILRKNSHENICARVPF